MPETGNPLYVQFVIAAKIGGIVDDSPGHGCGLRFERAKHPYVPHCTLSAFAGLDDTRQGEGKKKRKPRGQGSKAKAKKEEDEDEEEPGMDEDDDD